MTYVSWKKSAGDFTGEWIRPKKINTIPELHRKSATLSATEYLSSGFLYCQLLYYYCDGGKKEIVTVKFPFALSQRSADVPTLPTAIAGM